MGKHSAFNPLPSGGHWEQRTVPGAHAVPHNLSRSPMNSALLSTFCPHHNRDNWLSSS